MDGPYRALVKPGEPIVSSFLWGRISMISPLPYLPPENHKYYWTQMPVNPGNSGGGVFSQRTGQIVGVVSSMLEARGAPTGLSQVIPMIHIRRWIAELSNEED